MFITVEGVALDEIHKYSVYSTSFRPSKFALSLFRPSSRKMSNLKLSLLPQLDPLRKFIVEHPVGVQLFVDSLPLGKVGIPVANIFGSDEVEIQSPVDPDASISPGDPAPTESLLYLGQ